MLHWADKGYSPQAIRKAMNQQERWLGMLLSGGKMSAVNMIRAVLRDEGEAVDNLRISPFFLRQSRNLILYF